MLFAIEHDNNKDLLSSQVLANIPVFATSERSRNQLRVILGNLPNHRSPSEHPTLIREERSVLLNLF